MKPRQLIRHHLFRPVTGSVLGVLVLGAVQTLISFEGTLSSWWTTIVVGALLPVFIMMHRLMARRTA